MPTQIAQNDPQKMFWKESKREVPQFILDGLKNMFGVDEWGDPNVRVRFEDEKFPEGVWIVEEKWQASAFGDPEDWKKTQKATDELGIVHDFGDFPSHGLYVASMLWTDYNGRPCDLDERLLATLKTQNELRQSKNISPEEVAFAAQQQLNDVENKQNERFVQAQREVAESIKMDSGKIAAAATRVASFANNPTTKNRLITKSDNL